MKNKKINLLLILVMVLSLVLTSTVFASAATVKLSKTKLRLGIGDTYYLNAIGAYSKTKWSSSKKSIATVNKYGKVTAKKVGKATITCKTKGKKYKCKLTVINPKGYRTNPADPTKGVTIKTYEGTLYFKLTNVYKSTDAINKFKELDSETWSFHEEYTLPDYAGYEIVGLEFDVAAKSGYEDFSLNGHSIISDYDLYNGRCNAKISNFHELSLLHDNGNLGSSNLKLYNGGSSKMYTFFAVPAGTTEFSNNIYTSNYKQYWIKYNI